MSGPPDDRDERTETLAQLRQRVAHVEGELERNLARLDLLVSLTRDVSLDLDGVLAQLLSDLGRAIPAGDIRVVYLYDPDEEVLAPRACHGYDEGSLSQVRLQPGESISGKVFQSGQSSLTRTPEEVVALSGPFRPETSQLYRRAIRGATIRSNICAPLVAPSGQILGTVTMSSTAEPFAEHDLELLEGVAGYVARAIDNAQLFAALAASEERHRVLLEGLPVGVVENTPEGELLYYSPAAQRILGYGPEEWRRVRAVDVYVDPDNRRELLEHLERDGRHDYEYCLRHRDGHAVWIRGTSRVLQGPEGTRLVGMFEDITGRRRQEARHRAITRVREQVWRMEGEDDIRKVLAAVREGLVEMEIPFLDCGINVVETVGDDLRVRLHVLTAQGEWIVTMDETGTRNVVNFWQKGEVAYRADLLADDPYAERELVQRILGSPIRTVLDLPFSRGTLAMNASAPNAFSPDDIAVTREMAAVLSEGFQRLDDLRQLASERERLLVTLHSIGDGVISTDAQGRVLLINQVTETLTGWTQDEAAGRPLSEVFHIVNERTGEPAQSPVDEVMEHGQVVGLANHTALIGRDGSRHIIADSGAPIRDAAGEMVGVVLVFRDITAQIHLEEELRRAEKLDSLGVLAGGIAHDFNNILTAVIGNVSLARMEVDPKDPLYENLSLVEEASQQAAALTQQLLTFSKGGAPVKRLASLDELMRDSATFALRGANVRCEFAIDDDLWPAEVDPGQMSQVVQNLVINANQAMPEGGVVGVSARNERLSEDQVAGLQAGSYLRIEVRDQGTGIPPGHLQRVFEPYFSTKQRGSGLGLATVHSIVTSHDGHISVASELGSGTAFTVYVPAEEGARADVDGGAAAVPRGCGLILVMDDDDAVRRLAGDMLKRLGYEVLFAEDGQQALEAYEKARSSGKPVDAVLLDLTIPGGMGGRETMERLREMDPQVRAIVSSGYSNDPIMSDARRFGFKGVVAKPYNVADLAAVVHRVTAGSRG